MNRRSFLKALAISPLVTRSPLPEAAPVLSLWRGSFRWRTGMTELKITGRTTNKALAGTFIKTYLDGTLAAVEPISPLTTFMHTISISSGYTDGQVVTVEVKGSSTETVIYDVYTSPVVCNPYWTGPADEVSALAPTGRHSIVADGPRRLIHADDLQCDTIQAIRLVPGTVVEWHYQASDW